MSFNQDTADDIFDEFLMNRACQAANFADFVSLLNMKAATYSDQPGKMELLTEILNDLKLYSQPGFTEARH